MQTRINLSNLKAFEIPSNLINAQVNSYKEFLEKELQVLFDEISPIEDYTKESWMMEFGKIRIGKPKISPEEAQKLGLSYDVPLFVVAKLINKRTGEIKEQELFVADLPLMTKRGSFIISGNERVVVMQLVRAEGVLFVHEKKHKGKDIFFVKLIPQRGKWLDFEMNANGVISVQLLNKRPRVLATTILRAVGYSSNEEILSLFRDLSKESIKFIEKTLKEDRTKTTEEALIDIFVKLRPEDSITLEGAKSLVENLFFNPRRFYVGRIGRYQLNKKIGTKFKITPENYTLKKEDLIGVIKASARLNAGELEADDIDHLANRRVRGPGELISEYMRDGMLQMEKNIMDRMGTYGADELITPSRLINTRPVVGALKHFFGSSSVSRYMDQENVLSELTIKRRVTAGGPGGLTKQSATFSVRDVHSSHYSRFCPVETPEGPMIGIVSHLAIYARINEFGFIEAPYRLIKKKISSKDNSKTIEGRILAEDLNSKFRKGYQIKAEDVKEVQSLNKSEIAVQPFVSNEVKYLAPDEEIGFKIGSSSVPLDEFENIINAHVFVRFKGGYSNVLSSEIDYIDVSPGQIAGLGLSLIPYSRHDDPTRTLMGANMQRQSVPLVNPESPIVGTGFEKYVAKASNRAIFADEDAEVRKVDGSKIELVSTKTKEKIVYKLDKFVRTNQNTCFNQIPRVKIGQKVKKGDLLADGASMDNGELALGKNILAAYMIWDGYNYEDAIIISERLVKDDVLTSIHISEYVRDIRETQLGPEIITTDIPNVSSYALRNLSEDGLVRIGARVEPRDILVGIIALKGETELTAEEKLLRAIFGEYARDVRDNSLRLPHGERGIVIDTQILDKEKGAKLNPGVLKQVKVRVARTHKISVGDKLTGRHGDKGVIAKVVAEEDMPYTEDGTPVDIILSPLFLKRMNLGQLMETKMGRIAHDLGLKVEIPPFSSIDESEIFSIAKKKGINTDSKIDLYDGRTGKKFSTKIVVGYRYILKLKHLADDKVHARSTGPYTMVTQQPLGGKAQFGGQRFGEMEVWALEAHTAPNVLQEMLTIKSDDVMGRANAYKSIIQGQPVEAPNVPESFRVLVSELRSLGMNIELIGEKKDIKAEQSETFKKEQENKERQEKENSQLNS